VQAFADLTEAFANASPMIKSFAHKASFAPPTPTHIRADPFQPTAQVQSKKKMGHLTEP